MKIAIVGSRNLTVENLESFVPDSATEIVSGGAVGVDSCARDYALSRGIKYTEFLPDYKKYGRRASLERNIEIIDYADIVFAFWDGKSRGTRFVIDNCRKRGKKVKIYVKRG